MKLLGQQYDRCQLVLVQLVEFLARSKEQTSNAMATKKRTYLELLPDLETLCNVLSSVWHPQFTPGYPNAFDENLVYVNDCLENSTATCYVDDG